MHVCVQYIPAALGCTSYTIKWTIHNQNYDCYTTQVHNSLWSTLQCVTPFAVCARHRPYVCMYTHDMQPMQAYMYTAYVCRNVCTRIIRCRSFIAGTAATRVRRWQKTAAFVRKSEKQSKQTRPLSVSPFEVLLVLLLRISGCNTPVCSKVLYSQQLRHTPIHTLA